MKISVVMTTYNGEEFVEEQLESMRRQTRQADQVVIVDDRSTDATAEKVRGFIGKYGLENSGWRFLVNEENLGWQNNFMKAFSLADGDLIFPCDQDDVWAKRKIERMTAVMMTHPYIELLAADFEKLVPDGDGGWKAEAEKGMSNDGRLEARPFDEKMLFIYRPGCVHCFRRELFEAAKDYSFADYPHDALLWRTAGMMDGLYIYHYISIRYRRHGDNAAGTFIRANDTMVETIEYYLQVLEQMKRFCREYPVDHREAKIGLIEENEQFMELRLRVFQGKKVVGKDSYVQLLKYARFYPAWTSVPGDLYKMFGKSGSDHK